MGRLVTLTEASELMTLVDRVKEHVKMPRGKTLPTYLTVRLGDPDYTRPD